MRTWPSLPQGVLTFFSPELYTHPYSRSSPIICVEHHRKPKYSVSHSLPHFSCATVNANKISGFQFYMYKNHLRNYLVGSLGRSVDLLQDSYQRRKTQKHTPVFRKRFETTLRVAAEGDMLLTTRLV